MNNTILDKASILLKQNQQIFHTGDLAVLWNMKNRASLRVVISRYIKNGILYPIQKGLYSIRPIKEIDKNDLGASLFHKYSYISLETILFREGVISQYVYPITFVSTVARWITIGDTEYSSRKMPDAFLYNQAGIIRVGNHLEATLERAVADMRYYNPMYYFDVESIVDWKIVKEIQKKVGY